MPNNHLNPGEARPKRDPWLGIALVGIAIAVFVLSRSIQAIGLGDNFDPGPKTFPLGLSAILAIGGLIEIWQGFRSKASETQKMSPGSEPDEGSRSKTVLLLLACFLVYVLLLPWLGFSVATLIMATGMMILLGNSWKLSALVSITLIVLIYFLFVILFKVPLPGGIFNLPF